MPTKQEYPQSWQIRTPLEDVTDQPAETSTGLGQMEEFYDTTLGQLALLQDDFIDPNLDLPAKPTTLSVGELVHRDDKVKDTLQKLMDVGFDISSLSQLKRLQPVLADPEALWEWMTDDEYSQLYQRLLEDKDSGKLQPKKYPQSWTIKDLDEATDIDNDGPEVSVKPSISVEAPSEDTPADIKPSMQPSQAEPGVAMPSEAEMLDLAAEMAVAEQDPAKGPNWVKFKIKQQKADFDSAGLDGAAFEKYINGMIASMKAAMNDE